MYIRLGQYTISDGITWDYILKASDLPPVSLNGLQMLGREAALAVGLEEVPRWERRLFDWSQKEPSWKTLKVINGWEIPNGDVYGKIIYKWKVDESGPLPCFTTSAISNRIQVCLKFWHP